jgi:indole-3-glycerol phosphate synthase
MLNQDCPDILKKIVATKKAEIIAMRQTIADFKSVIANIPTALDFKAALTKSGLSIIAEIKKASPSAGIIAEDFIPKEIAKAYNSGGADAVSVLTDKEYFKGDIEYINRVRDIIKVPILRKDFIIDPIQIYEARAHGADSFLLIAAILNTDELKELASLGRELGMEPLVESHNEQELGKSIDIGAQLIGINNRNLHTFEVDISQSEKLFPLIPENAIAIAESGIHSPEQAHRLHNAGFSAILVGESLMKAGLQSCGNMITAFKK